MNTFAFRPAVSVVVPCYDGGRFLDAPPACLTAQTFKDFENRRTPVLMISVCVATLCCPIANTVGTDWRSALDD